MVQTAEPGVASDTAEARPAPTASRWGIVAAAAVTLVVAAVLLVRLGAQERGGPAHTDLSIGTGLPATLYLPQDTVDGEFPAPRAEGSRPPLVIVAHGYSADRLGMSRIGRSLAKAGYASLTFDFRGHGENTAPFKGDLKEDLDAAMDWADSSPYVDSERVAVLGHSMGAGAALDFATIDQRPVAVVAVSGGWFVNDDRVPPNVLFLVAENDPGSIHDRQNELARDLEGDANVRAVEISGTDHVTILWSGRTIQETARFLDPVFGIERTGGLPGLDDPRLATVALYLLVVLVLTGFIGLMTGRVVPPLPSGGSPRALLLVAGALLVTLPLFATGGFNVLPIGPGQPVIVHTAMAAAVLWTLRHFARRGALAGGPVAWLGDAPWLPLRSVLLPGVAAALAIVLLLAPAGVVFHRLVPTAERAVLWLVVAALALPFFAAFEALVRRGSLWASIGWGVLGRVVLLAALVVGLALSVLPRVLGLVVPLLVLQYVVLEIFAAACYRRGRNPAVIAVVDAVFLGWVATTLTPVS